MYEINKNITSPMGYIARIESKNITSSKSPIMEVYFDYTSTNVDNIPSEDIGKVILKNDKEWYIAIKNAIKEFKDEIEYNISYSSDIVDMVNLVLEQNPDIAYIESYEHSSGGKIKFNYKFSKNKLEEMKKSVDLKAKEVISKVIKPGMSEGEKAKAIHDYLVLNTEYDHDNYINNTIPTESYTAYGVLIKGVGVCQGYTGAFKTLAEMVGIECIGVTGLGKQEPHAWNLVKLDGLMGSIDVTWDDPVPDKKGKVRYNYFNISEDIMRKDHSWDSSKFNSKYFSYNNASIKNSNTTKQPNAQSVSVSGILKKNYDDYYLSMGANKYYINAENDKLATYLNKNIKVLGYRYPGNLALIYMTSIEQVTIVTSAPTQPSGTENISVYGKVSLVKGQYVLSQGAGRYTLKGASASTLKQYVGKYVKVDGYRYKNKKAVVYVKTINN